MPGVGMYTPQTYVDDDGSGTTGTPFTKAGMDTLEAGVKAASLLIRRVVVVSNSNITVASPGATIDSVALSAGDRVLLAAQTTQSQNGIYVWNGAAVAMTRATDMATGSTALGGQQIYVYTGTSGPGAIYHVLGDAVVGTDAMTLKKVIQPQKQNVLPANPFEGQECDICVDETNGVTWRFRYRALTNAGGANGNTYKWEFNGGSPLYAFSAASAAVASAVYGQVMDSGWTVPFAGDYLIRWGLKADASVSGVDTFTSIGIGGAPANDNLAVEYAGYVGPAYVPVAATRRFTGLTAAQTVKMYTRAVSGTAGTRDKWIEMQPVRVG